MKAYKNVKTEKLDVQQIQIYIIRHLIQVKKVKQNLRKLLQ